MLHGDARSRGARYHQRALVYGSVMRGAEGEQVCRVMTAAVGARMNVVNVNERGAGAPRDLAAVMVAPQHAAAHGGRDILSRSRGCIRFRIAHVGVRHLLRIASGHRSRCRRHFEQLAVASLAHSPAVFAHVERHLVAGASIVRWSAEHMPRE